MASQRIEDALQLLRAEYLDLPGLALTPTQVAALVALDKETAAVLFQALEGSGFLDLRQDGRFVYRQH